MVYSIKYRDERLVVYKHSSSGFVVSVLGKRVNVKNYDTFFLNFKSFFKYMSAGAELKLNRHLVHLFSLRLGVKPSNSSSTQ
jgi:hypothetical protein